MRCSDISAGGGGGAYSITVVDVVQGRPLLFQQAMVGRKDPAVEAMEGRVRQVGSPMVVL